VIEYKTISALCVILQMTDLDVNIRDGALMTPLMWASYHCRPEHVRTLLERGADSSLQDIDGMSAVHWSIHRHDNRVLQASKHCMQKVNSSYLISICALIKNFDNKSFMKAKKKKNYVKKHIYKTKILLTSLPNFYTYFFFGLIVVFVDSH